MSREDKVLCQCCGKMMVPKVILSRGLYSWYGWGFGGGKPESSCCPFCLSTTWEGLPTGNGWRFIAWSLIVVGAALSIYSKQSLLIAIFLMMAGLVCLSQVNILRFFTVSQLLSFFRK